MSRFTDRPVCITGETICPGWTPLHVNALRAEPVVSMWMFMEIMSLFVISSECNTFRFKQLLVIRKVLRRARRMCSGWYAGNFRRIVSLKLKHLCLAS